MDNATKDLLQKVCENITPNADELYNILEGNILQYLTESED